MPAAPRPHDLLWPVADAVPRVAGERPAWATAAWLAAAPMVVRRAPRASDGRVPVGLRGRTRNERCAAHVEGRDIARRCTPEAVAHAAATNARLPASPLPCLRALSRLAAAFDEWPLAWGVTGSIGFSLASGIDVLRHDSDLDLLVRAPSASDAATLRRIGSLIAGAGCRVDLQVETPVGAFALSEWLRTGGPVLLKTNDGPLLGTDPWQPAVSSITA